MWYYVVDNDMDTLKKYSPRAVLRRSGSAAPLHLWMASTPEPPADSISRWVIKNQPSRVEALYVHLYDKAPVEVMLDSLAAPLPSLRLLSIDGTWQCRGLPAAGMPTILGGGALSLKALVWSLSIPFIPGNAFPNLADLNLNDLGSNVLTLDRLLQLLANCPHLETLVLSHSSLDIKSSVVRGQNPIKLDHLRALWMHSMGINAALTALSCLRLPVDATVRLSDLTQYEYRSELAEPPTAPVAFLQHMDDLTSLDIITCKNRTQNGLHFVAVGVRSRFWIHFNAGSADVRSYVRYLYGMLPKNNLRTLRFSMQETADFVFVRDTMRDPLPSLHTLLVRHSKTTSPSGVAAISRALCPGGAPEPNATERPRRSHDTVPADFPIDLSADLPAPQLKIVGLEVRNASAASLRPFVCMVEARKKCGHPLDTVWCNLEGVDQWQKRVEDLKEYVANGAHAFRGKLWFPTIDEGWLVKNDHWRLCPEPRDDWEDGYADWGFSMGSW